MKSQVATALVAFGSGLALAVAAVAMILWRTNDMRWLLVLGSVVLFGLGLWQGGRRRADTVGFVLLCLPLLTIFCLLILPELPGLWPHLPLWIGSALLGWWGFRSGRRTAPAVLLAVVVLAIVSSWYALAYVPGSISRSLNRSVDEPAPAIALEHLDGSPYPADLLAGNVVVLDFFATWCAPCIAELPEIDAIHRSYAGASDVQVLVVANLTGGDTREKIRSFVDGHDFAVPFVIDPGATAHGAFGFTGLPGLVVIDRENHIRFQRQGYNAAEAGFEQTVVEIVEELRRPQS
jgi:thiol-disulfide isomerase/thioredoxin